jgi:signal transduction histidine kinase
VAKAWFYFNPETVIHDLLKIFLGTIGIVTIIAIVMGYLFSMNLAKPLVKIIAGIQSLAKGDFDKRYPVKGLYKDVLSNLNRLSESLQANDRERKNIEKMREEWITNISHDVKTPLASIKGYTEMLLDQEYKLNDEERKKYAEIILNKAHYIEQLMEDLNLTYQLKKSILLLKRQDVNLVELLRETIIDILNHPHYEEVNIDFNPQSEEIILNCDSTLISRALSNVIYNAIVHNPKGTKIEVNIKKEREIIIEIVDDGKGIPKVELEKLFDRYYRGTNTGEEHKGSGLGMAIAKQIIEAHHGKIMVNSKVGVGTTVKIIF